MYLVAIFAAILSFISPFWGLFLIVGFGSKYNTPKQNSVFWIVNVSVFLALAVLSGKSFSTINLLDSFIGSTLLSIIYFWALNSSKYYTKAIFVTFFVGFVFSILRYYYFSDEITKSIKTAYDIYMNYLDKSTIYEKDKLVLIKDIMWKTKNILSSYQISIWNFSEMFFLYLSVLIALKKRMENRLHKTFRLPYISIYLLIVFLIMDLIVPLKHLGYNLTFSITPLFIIQGFSILDYFWGDFFSRSKILLFLLIISLLLNTFVLILIALMGLLDIWFDFRKLKYNV